MLRGRRLEFFERFETNAHYVCNPFSLSLEIILFYIFQVSDFLSTRTNVLSRPVVCSLFSSPMSIEESTISSCTSQPCKKSRTLVRTIAIANPFSFYKCEMTRRGVNEQLDARCECDSVRLITTGIRLRNNCLSFF